LAQRISVPQSNATEVVREVVEGPVKVLERQDGWLVCLIDGFYWRLDPTQCIDADILDDGLFEPTSIKWVDQVVKPGMVVVDVGANFGYYTLRLSRLVGPSGQVHAFEPSVRYRERLLDHLRQNGCSNVIVMDYGLSDQSAEHQLYGDNVSATMHWHDDAKSPTVNEKIVLRTLDSYVQGAGISRLDFIKVDIDGHEPSFVAGASQTLSRFRPLILMEFANLSLWAAGSNAESLGRQLTELGYSLHCERTDEPYPSHADFLRDAMNCSHSVNIFCYPDDRT
jgi:FkbM family methyltransferase